MILNKIKKLIVKQHPKKKYIYAVTTGKYVGELLVYMKTEDTMHSFLSIPAMSIRDIPAENFNTGIQNNIVEVVEKLPSKVFNVCKLQYAKNNCNLVKH